MSKVKVKKVTKEVVHVTLTEKEAQALSDLLCRGVAYDTLEEIGLYGLNDKLADLFPETIHTFDEIAKQRS